MPVPTITGLPAAPQRTMAETEYAGVADAWVAALPPWTDDVNDMAAWMDARAADAEDAAATSESIAVAVNLAASQAATGLPLVAGHASKVLTVAADEQSVGWERALPAGVILYVDGDSAPAGTLVADGSLYHPATYARLFARLGTRYGGNGTTTFGVPDARGLVPRGLDNGRGFDLGRSLGSYQADQNASHTHDAGTLVTSTAGGHPHYESSIQIGATAGPQTIRAAGNETRGAHTHVISGATGAAGGTEVRVKNIAWLAVITY